MRRGTFRLVPITLDEAEALRPFVEQANSLLRASDKEGKKAAIFCQVTFPCTDPMAGVLIEPVAVGPTTALAIKQAIEKGIDSGYVVTPK